MPAVTVNDLRDQIAQIRSQPTLAYEKGQHCSLDELRQAMSDTRLALVAAIRSASDSAFEPQPANDEGDEVWSVGPIVAHCNGAMMNIGGQALTQMGVEAGEPPAALAAAAESRVMSRDEAIASATVIDTDDFFAMIPDDERLDKAADHDFFGTMTGRTWLYFMAMHEAEHIGQIESLG